MKKRVLIDVPACFIDVPVVLRTSSEHDGRDEAVPRLAGAHAEFFVVSAFADGRFPQLDQIPFVDGFAEDGVSDVRRPHLEAEAEDAVLAWHHGLERDSWPSFDVCARRALFSVGAHRLASGRHAERLVIVLDGPEGQAHTPVSLNREGERGTALWLDPHGKFVGHLQRVRYAARIYTFLRHA